MNILDVVRVFNRLKRQRKLKDYAVFGAVGASYYMAPVYTTDVDVLVLADTDQDYVLVWRELRKHAEKVKDWGFVIAETDVQVLPTSVHPLFASALKNARKIRVGNTVVRVVDREHLIMLFLKANRVKDRFKASMLLAQADMAYLNSLLARFDDDGTLKTRLQSLNQGAHS